MALAPIIYDVFKESFCEFDRGVWSADFCGAGISRAPQLRTVRIFLVSRSLCAYARPGAIVHANACSSKVMYSTEIVIATPYNDNIDIIQDSPVPTADFVHNAIFITYA